MRTKAATEAISRLFLKETKPIIFAGGDQNYGATGTLHERQPTQTDI